MTQQPASNAGATRATSQIDVAVTGLAVACGLGDDAEEVWRAVLDGQSGVRPIQRLDSSPLRCRVASELISTPPGSDRALGLAVRVAREALNNAGVDLSTVDRFRRGLALGTSVGGLERGEEWHGDLLRRGLSAIRSGLLLTYPLYTSADAVSAELGLQGPKVVISNACAAGGNAIGWAADEIRLGRADVMIAGGVDVLDLLSLGGFDNLKALDPEPCAPLSRSTGINLGEGAGFVVLESAEQVESRGVSPIAWFRGYGISSDAHHATAPDPRGDGARRSMACAVRRADLTPGDVGYLNAHGTGTPANDSAEPRAVDALFGEDPPPMSSTKSQIGHTLGAAGAVEAVVTILALHHQELPPTINVQQEAQPSRDIVANRARSVTLSAALSNSFAFGGNNCSLLFATERSPEKPRTERRRVVVTGTGLVCSLGTTRAGLVDSLQSGRQKWVTDLRLFPGARRHITAALDPASYLPWIEPSYLRRVDQLGALVLAGTRMALADSTLTVPRGGAERYGLAFGTFTGPLETVSSLSETIINRGVEQVSPRAFPNSVVNAAAGHACLALGLKGPLSTLATGCTAGIGALQYATDLIGDGEADVMLVAAADELTPELHLGYDRLGLLGDGEHAAYSKDASGMVPGAGSAVLVLEDFDHATARGAPMLAEVAGAGFTNDVVGIGRIDPTGEAWADSMRSAGDRAGLKPEEIHGVYGDARGTTGLDHAEARAIASALGTRTRVSHLSSLTGHLGSTTPLVSAVAALRTLQDGWMPTAPEPVQPIAEAAGFNLDGHPGGVAPPAGVLVTAANWGGTYGSVVLSRVRR